MSMGAAMPPLIGYSRFPELPQGDGPEARARRAALVAEAEETQVRLRREALERMAEREPAV